MADLRKAARSRECQVRIPGVCNGNPETSVLAHIRLTGLCGTGIKPPDLIATIACSACHDEIDRRTHFVDVIALCMVLASGQFDQIFRVVDIVEIVAVLDDDVIVRVAAAVQQFHDPFRHAVHQKRPALFVRSIDAVLHAAGHLVRALEDRREEEALAAGLEAAQKQDIVVRDADLNVPTVFPQKHVAETKFGIVVFLRKEERVHSFFVFKFDRRKPVVHNGSF